jgi:titin
VAVAAFVRALRHSDRGVTAVEYGLLIGVFGVAMVGAAGVLYTASTASYNQSETEVANPRAACIGDEIIDPDTGECTANPMRITSVNPSYGPTTGGTTIVITGEGYAAGATVTVRGVPATVTAVSATSITAVTPAGALGAADITITNPASVPDPDAILSGLSKVGFGRFVYAAVPGQPDPPSGVAGNGSVLVSWAAPTDTGGLPIDEYTLERSINGTTWTNAVTTPDTTYTVTGLTNGTTYYFRVRASNEFGAGPFSAASEGLRPQATAPLAPTITSVTGGVGQLSVAFTSGADGGSAITTYQYSVNGGTWTNRAPSSTASPLVIGSLANGTEYSVQIRAVNAIGPGAASNAFPGTTVGAAQAPTIDSITPGDRQLSVAFTAPGSDGGSAITTYQYSTDNGGSWKNRQTGSTASPLVITTVSSGAAALQNGTAYTVRIRAINGLGEGAQSDPVTATPATVPGSPTLGTITPGKGRLTVNWSPPASDGGQPLTGYVVEIDERGNNNSCASTFATTATFTTPSAGTTSHTFTGLSNDKYCVRVRALNGIDPGSDWAQSSGTYLVSSRTAPSVPQSVVAISTVSGSITVTWAEPADDGGDPPLDYRVDWEDFTSQPSNCSSQTINDGSTTTADLTTTFTGLNTSRWFCIEMRAENSVGDSSYVYYGPIRAVPPSAPDAPTSLSGTRGNQQVALTWNAPADDGGASLTDYLVQYGTSSSGPWTTFDDGTSTSESATVTGLTNGTAYYFRVAAVNPVGTSAYSSVAGPYTPKAPYTGSTPSNRYPASGEYNVSSGSTYSLSTLFSIPTLEFTGSSCSGNGCSRSSFDTGTGVFTFNSNFGSRTAAYTVSWSIPETATVEGANGSFTIYFD